MMDDDRSALLSASGSVDELLQSNDGLAIVSQMVARIAGKELSPDALGCMLHLMHTGCGDIASQVLGLKEYQANVADLIKFTETLSPASAQKEMLEAQTAAMRRDG